MTYYILLWASDNDFLALALTMMLYFLYYFSDEQEGYEPTAALLLCGVLEESLR
jgi:hypothetical protein